MAKYFSPSEIVGLVPELVAKLDIARDVSNVPYRISSGYRDPAANVAAGGVEGSAHEKGMAVDLACSESRQRYHILIGLMLAGFHRIGIYDRHIHADIDGTKPEQVIWVGVSS